MDGLKARLSFDAVAYDYDDEYLTIDTDTHTININNVSRLFGVQYDGNSKLIKFRIRNKLSDIQKMQDSIIYINWIDSKGVNGQSIAINKTINDDTCEFAWKVPFDALKNSGVLHFAMSAVMTKNSSSVIDQRWSTQIASVITPDGIYIKSYTPSSEEEDRIAQIYNELSNIINKQNDNLQSQVNSLKEDLDGLNERLTEYDGYNPLNLSYGNVSSMSTEITFNTDDRYVHTPLTLFRVGSKVGLSEYTDKFYTLYIKNEDGTFTRFYNQRADKVFVKETYACVVFNFYPETTIQSIDDFSRYVIYENKRENFHDTMTAKVEDLELEISAISPAKIFENRKYGLVYSGEIDKDTGNLREQTSTNKKVSDFIFLQDVAKLVCETIWSGVKLYFYDSKKNFIKSLNYSNSKSYFELKLTDEYRDASYVRYVGYDVNEKFLNYYLIAVKNYPNATSKFNNKNVLIFGDSITDACEITVNAKNQTTSYSFRGLDGFNRKMWSAILKDSYNFKEVRNYALSGATWKGDLSNARASSYSQITIALNDLNNPNGIFNQDSFTPDIVIFALGINDSSSNDTYEDAMNKTILIEGTNNIDVDATLNNLDHSKLNESIRWSLLKIKSQFPFAQVYVSLPLQCAKDRTVYGSTLVSDIRKMAERCGCIVIDSTNEVGIIPEGNFYNDGTKIGITLQDGLHPNAIGQQMLARAIIGKLNSCYYPID